MQILHPFSANQPIGIFDSGVGGLTIANALMKALPRENIVYFGDTAHMPYGDKSTAAIQAYAVKIVNMLLEQECKLILIACYSATAAAYELIKEYVASRTLVVNVVDPIIQLFKHNYTQKRIGLIGTRHTVGSNIFKRKINGLNNGIHFTQYPTNLLAPAIEEFGDHPLMDALLEVYLAPLALHDIDALALACTHYPIIKDRIRTYYQKSNKENIEVIDSSEIVAATVKQLLVENNLLNENGIQEKHFYVSDFTDGFAKNAKLFFGQDVTLEHYPLWH